MEQERKIFKINSLRKLAEQYSQEMTLNSDIWKVDVSNLIEAEVRFQIRNGEIVLIGVHSKPRLGKSTLGITVGECWIDDELKNCGKKDKRIKFPCTLR